MAKQTIDLGTQGGADGTGDSIRTAGDKINDNFNELYATSAVLSHINIVQNEISSTLSNADIDLKPSGTGSILFPGIRINDNNIEVTRSNDDLRIIPNGSGYVIIDGIGFSGTSIHAPDSSSININEGLTVGGSLSAGATNLPATTINSTLGVTGATTLSTLTVSGASSFAGTTTIDNLTFNDNIISTSSNADLNLTPGGTGVVNVSNLTIDSSVNLTDNIIKVTRSNDDFILAGNGTGSVQISKVDMNEGTVDNTVIGGTTPAAGTFTTLTFNPQAGGTLAADGVTVTDNSITANRSNDNLELEANGTGYVSLNGLLLPHTDGATGQVLRTNGSGQLEWFTSPILLGSSDIQDNQTTISFSTQNVIDHVTASGDHHRVESSTSVLDSFVTSKYDSAWYLAVNKDENSTEFEVVKHSLVHNNSDAFVSSSAITKTGTNNHIVTTADVNSGSARLLGTGSSSFNSMTYYRIGLGDDDSTGYAGEDEAAVVINTDVDSASEVIDSWAHANYRGAKYYISVNNDSKTELMNIEAVVVHDGTTAFVSSYNIVNTGNNDLLTLTAAINGANLELSASGLETNLRVHAYRILLADNEADRSGTNVNVIGNVTVSSATTTLDTFDSNSYQGAQYIVVGYNATEGAASICEAAVVTDGSNAFITQYAQTSTKGTDQITLSAAHDGSSTVTVSATSTSGGSTTVNAYRVNMAIPSGTSTATATLDSVSASTYRGAKYNVQVVDSAAGNYECFEVNVMHDGSTAYTSTFGNVGNNIDLITVSADVNAGNLRLRGTINNTNDHTVTVVRRVIEA